MMVQSVLGMELESPLVDQRAQASRKLLLLVKMALPPLGQTDRLLLGVQY